MDVCTSTLHRTGHPKGELSLPLSSVFPLCCPNPDALVTFFRQLMENQISVVERGVFDDMKELERL